MTVNINDVNAAVSLVSAALPVVGTAYTILRAIWLRTNPGKTEADFQAYLQTASEANIDDSDAILKADEFVEDPPGSGNWHKPIAPPTAG